MKYFEVKGTYSDNGKTKTSLIITKSYGVVESYGLTTGVGAHDEVLGVNLKNYVEVFNNDKSTFYEIKLEWDSVDDKVVKELYLQKADSTQEAESLLKANIDSSNVEITGTVKKNYIDYIVEQIVKE